MPLRVRPLAPCAARVRALRPRARRRTLAGLLLVLTAAAGLPGAVTAPGAAAAPTAGLVVPARASTGARFHLVAASPEATVVRQDGVPGLLWTTGGRPLAAVPGAPDDAGADAAGTVRRLVGTTLYTAAGATLTRTDLATGTSDPVPLGGDLFLGAGPAGIALLDPGTGTVRLTGAGPDRVVVSGVAAAGPADVTVTAAAVLLRYRAAGVPAGGPTRTVLWHEATGATEPLPVPAESWLPAAVMSDDTVMWWDGWGGGYDSSPVRGSTVHLRAVAGGAVRDVPFRGLAADPVAAPGHAAFLSASREPVLLGADGRARTVGGVTGVTGMAPAGDGLRLVRSGPASVAGVWTLTGTGRLRREAGPVPAAAPVTDVSVAAGRVVVTRDDGDPRGGRTGGGGTLSVVPLLRSSGVLALGAERPAAGVGGWSLAYDNTVYTTTVERWLDAGRPTAATVEAWRGTATSSGPWAESNNGVWRADGAYYRLGAGQLNGVNELFGPTLLVLPSFDSAVVQDLRSADPGATGRVLPAKGELLRGAAVAWARRTGIVVHSLATGRERFLRTPSPGFRVVDGALLYRSGDATADGPPDLLLDVAAHDPVPRQLADVVPAGVPADALLSLDEGVAVWADAAQQVHVVPLQGLPAHRPLILGSAVADAFSPDGDGVDDMWRPALDLTRPVTDAAIRITGSAGVVRVLPVTGPFGAVRDARWDGLDAAGAPVPDGTYRWVLEGRSADGAGVADGGGGPLDVDGRSVAGGTVTVRRAVLPLRVSFLPATDPRVPAGGVVARWRPLADDVDGWTYDVRVRPRYWLRGPAPEAQVLRTATAARRATWTAYSPWVDVSVRAHDPSGRVGSWSPWRTAAPPRPVEAPEGWKTSPSADAVLGTATVSTARGAELVLRVEGDRLSLLGTRCPGCGAVEVWVDGARVGTARTAAGDTRPRSVLWRGRFLWGVHDVRVVAPAGPVRLEGVEAPGAAVVPRPQ